MKFLIYLIRLALPLLLILVLLEYRLTLIETSYSRQKDHLVNKLSDIETLIAGSSNTLFGINPAFLDTPAFNLANRSQDIYYDYLLTRKYLPFMSKLKTVLISISYHTYEFSLVSAQESWRTSYYWRIYRLESVNHYGLNPSNYSYILLLKPEGVRKYILSNFKDVKLEEYSDWGWYNPVFEETFSLDDLHGSQSVGDIQKQMFKSNINDNVRRLKAMISLLKNKGINIIFITLPVHDSFSKFVNRESYEKMQKITADISDREDIRYLNYFLDKRFTDEDFFDTSHLNSQGARKMSLILNDKLQEFQANGQ